MDSKALSWQHVDPSSVILGPGMKNMGELDGGSLFHTPISRAVPRFCVFVIPSPVKQRSGGADLVVMLQMFLVFFFLFFFKFPPETPLPVCSLGFWRESLLDSHYCFLSELIHKKKPHNESHQKNL